MTALNVVYHDKCFDGFTAAWVVWHWAKTQVDFERVHFCPASYGSLMPQLYHGAPVLFVDFSAKRDVLLKLLDFHPSVVVLDHHATAMVDLADLPEPAHRTFPPGLSALFDMNRSGAGMAWDFFFPADLPRPAFVNMVESRDLWKFDVPGSKSFHAYLKSFPFQFNIYDAIWSRSMFEVGGIEAMVREGEAIERYQQQQVDKICALAEMRKLDGDTVVVCNATSDWSEVGHQLLEMHPYARYSMTYWDVEPGKKRQYSLRSRPDVAVNEVAKRYGGGGHAQAAGFVLSLDTNQRIDVFDTGA